MKTRILLSTITMVLLAACAEKTGESASAAPPVAPKAPDNAPQVKLDELEGQWQSNCQQGQMLTLFGKTSVGLTERSTLQVADLFFTETSHVTSLLCEGSDIEFKTLGKFTRKNGRQASPAIPIQPVAIQIKNYIIKPITPFGARVLNLARWCGVKDWEIGVERDMTESVGKERCFKTRSIETVYTIENGDLFFGATDQPAASASAGPVNKNLIFKKL